MINGKAVLLVLLPLLVAAQQTKKKIARAADLPQFEYPVQGTVEDLIKSDELFKPFAAQIRRNVESVLRDYDIQDAETKRSLLGTLAALDLLEGRDEDLRNRLDEIRALEERPAQKLMSGITERAILDARAQSRDRNSPAYRQALYNSVRQALEAMPFDMVQTDVARDRRRAVSRTESATVSRIRARYDPVVQKTGALGSNLAHDLPSFRVALTEVIPVNVTLNEAYGAYLGAHAKEKADIWTERDVTLEPGMNYAPVAVAVWDGGVDIGIFRDQLKRDESGNPAVIAYDASWTKTTGALLPLTSEQQKRYATFKALLKGRNDLEANIDSTEAAELRKRVSELDPDQARSFQEEIQLFGQAYSHGTHVSGIALAGNPYARLVVARMNADHKCRSRELTERIVAAHQKYIAFFRKNGVRVVNMSFGGTLKNFEARLEQCTVGKTPDERKQLARELFDMDKRSLETVFRSAPEILFVASAGNEGSDASFNEMIPASIVLPNTMTVGAVDRAGDEAPFTNYGPAVVVHANGYEVESYLPGGDRLKRSGTSMATPQVVNLAAKMLAVNPKLTAEEVKQIIVSTADRTADGRRNLINPREAVAAAKQRK